MKMEPLYYKDIHEASEVITSSFEEDPVWKMTFPNVRQRRCAVYSIMAGELFARSLSSTRVIKDKETGKILSICLFEQERYNALIFLLRSLLGGILQSYYFFFVKLAIEVFGSANPVTFVLAILYSILSLFFFLYTFNIVKFMFYFNISIMKEKQFMKEKGWLKKKRKYLLAFATAPEAQGKGLGSKLMTDIIAELDKEGYYDGYHLESSNTRNVPFYERNKFENIGEATVSGKVITIMVRPSEKAGKTTESLPVEESA